MKKVILAAAFAGLSSTAMAGGLAPVTIEVDPPVVAPAGSSASGLLIPLVLVALIAAAAGDSDSASATE